MPGYEILLPELGYGGMGVVYKAKRRSDGEFVALKIMNMISPGAQADEGQWERFRTERERFRTEAETMKGLKHPGILEVYEVGEFEVGDLEKRPFFSMKYVEKGSLADKLDEVKAAKQKVLPSDAARIVELLARAIHHAHTSASEGRGVVHRDLKPANVLLDTPADDQNPKCEWGCPKVCDFGLVKRLGEGTGLTGSGEVMGTPTYMAPEQAKGGSKDVGPAADIWALGAILYECLTGQTPFQGGVSEILNKLHKFEVPEPVSELRKDCPDELEIICLKCLRPLPKYRYANAKELADELARFQKKEPIKARRPGLSECVELWCRRHPWWTLLLTLAAIISLSVGGLAGISSRKDKQIGTLGALQKAIAEFEACRKEADWSSPKHSDRTVALLTQMMGLDKPTADRYWEKFATDIQTRMTHEARLKEADVAGVRHVISLLKNHSRVRLERGLNEALVNRLSSLQPQWRWDVKQGVEGLDRVEDLFDPDDVKVEPTGLSHRGAPLVITRAPCGPGGAQLTAEFDPSWEHASEIGLELNAGKGTGYRFSLRTVAAKIPGRDGGHQTPTSFLAAREGPEKILQVRVERNGVLLHEAERNAGKFPHGKLRLSAKREGAALHFFGNDNELLAFDDIFALPSRETGCFGILWPAGVRILSLEAKEVLKPRNSSELDKGDVYYAAGQPGRAREAYQAVREPEGVLGQEVRYKIGLCKVAEQRIEKGVPGRDGDAAKLFETLATENTEGPWPRAAAVQLWSLVVQDRSLVDVIRDKRWKDPDYIPAGDDKLTFSQLVARVPMEARKAILEDYRRRVPALHGQNLDPNKRIQAAKRWVNVENLVNGDATESRFWLSRAYFLKGDVNSALLQLDQLSEKALPLPLYLLEERVWLLRQQQKVDRQKRVDQALAELAKQEASGPASPALRLSLALLKAECHAALDQWDRVAEDLNPHLFRGGHRPEQRADLARPWLMLGFVRERRGDEAGALEAWRKANEVVSKPTEWGGMLEFSIAKSLSKKSDGQDVVRAFQGRAMKAQVGATLAVAAGLPGLKTVAQHMWRTPKGREWARKVVFRDLSYAEQFSKPPTLAAFEYARQHALRGSHDEDQLDVLWQAAEQLFQHAVENREEMLQKALLVAKVWRPEVFLGILARFDAGTPPRADDLIKALPKSIQAEAAYVLAHRLIYLKKTDEARQYFELAVKLGAASKVSNLAATDLRLVRTNSGLLILHCEVPGEPPREVAVTVNQGVKAITMNTPAGKQVSHELEVGDWALRPGVGAGKVTLSRRDVSVPRCGRVHVYIRDRWKPADVNTSVLPGLVPRPAPGLGIGRWQLETRVSPAGWNAEACSPDGKYRAFPGKDGHVRVEEYATGKLTHFFVGHMGEVNCVAWNPDSKRLASGGWDPAVRVWGIEPGSPDLVLRAGPEETLSTEALAWSPDGIFLVTCRRFKGKGPKDSMEDRRQLHVWDANTGVRLGAVDLPNTPVVKAVTWSPDYKVTVDDEKAGVQVWTVKIKARGEVELEKARHDANPAVRFIPQALRKESAGTFSAFAFCPDGKRLAIGTRDGMVRLGNLDDLKDELVPGLPRDIERIAWNRVGNRLAVLGSSGEVFLLRAGTQKLVKLPSSNMINDVAWSPDGNQLVSGASNGSLQTWSADAKLIKNLAEKGDEVGSVAWSPDGKSIAVGPRVKHKPVRIWDVDAGRFGLTIQGPGEVMRLLWNPAKRPRLAGFGKDYRLRVWDTQSGVELLGQGEIHTGRQHRDLVYALAWSPDGNLLATGDHRGVCRIWNMSDPEPRKEIRTSCSPIRSLTWIDGGQLVSGGDNGVVRWWNASSGEPLRVLVHLPGRQALTLTPGGEVLDKTTKANAELLYLREDDLGRTQVMTPAQFAEELEKGGSVRPPATPKGAP